MEEVKKKKNRNVVTTIFKTIVCVFLCLYVLSLVYPLFWGLLTSLKATGDFDAPNKNILGFPTLDSSNLNNSIDQVFKLQNYIDVFKAFSFTAQLSYLPSDSTQPIVYRNPVNFFTIIGNTLFYTVGSGLLGALSPLLMGYMCGRYPNAFSKFLYSLNIVIMALPIIGSTPAVMNLMIDTGLQGTLFGNMIRNAGWTGMYFLFFAELFRGMSNTYAEAAQMDGASHFTVFIKIYFPLSVILFGTVFLLKFVDLWNDYTAVNLYMSNLPTLTYTIWKVTRTGMLIKINGTDRNVADLVPVTMAATYLAALPTVALFIAFSDKLMGNLSMGGIKE